MYNALYCGSRPGWDRCIPMTIDKQFLVPVCIWYFSHVCSSFQFCQFLFWSILYKSCPMYVTFVSLLACFIVFYCLLLCLLGTLCSRAHVTFVTFYVIIVIVIVLVFLIVFVLSCVQRFSVWRCSYKINSVWCSSDED